MVYFDGNNFIIFRNRKRRKSSFMEYISSFILLFFRYNKIFMKIETGFRKISVRA